MNVSFFFLVGRLARLVMLVLAAYSFAFSVARAGLTINVNLYHDTIGYYFYPYLSEDTNTPFLPDGTYYVNSPQVPTNGSGEVYYETNNTLSGLGGGGNYYYDFDSFMYGITNGQWSIVYSNNIVTNLFLFTVSFSGINSNGYGPPVLAVFPVSGGQFVTNQPLFQWTGPANWAGSIYVQDILIDTNGNNDYETSANLTANQTSWPCPIVLPDGTNDFYVQYSSNVTAFVVSSTPTNHLGQAIAAWTSAATMQTEFAYDPQFAVGQAPLVSGGHTLLAHYPFDNSGDLGEDTSTNNNSELGEEYWGPLYSFSTDAEVGGGAIRFVGTSALSLYGQTLNNIENVLVGSFTFSGWVNTTNTQGSDSDDAIFGATIFWAYNDRSNTNDAIPLCITGSKAAFTTRDDMGQVTTLHSVTSVNDGNYHLITVTRDQPSGAMRMYVDGNFEAVALGTTQPLNANTNAYSSLSVGGQPQSSYTGLLDDLQIYSGVLSDTEVAELYNNPGTTVSNVSALSGEFNNALGTSGLSWDTSGDTSWFVESTNTFNDLPGAAQSGSVTNYQTSVLSLTVNGPGTLTYVWSTMDDCNNFYCEYAIDGSPDYTYPNDIQCSQQWVTNGPYSIPAGQHILTWTAYANGDTDPTQAAYVDAVNYTPTSTNTGPLITLNPVSQTNYPGYSVALFAAVTSNPTATFQWYEVGDSSPIPNATNTLFIPANSGTAGVAGSYYAIASNLVGAAFSTTAAVTFVSAPLPPNWARAFRSPFFSANDNFYRDYNSGCAADSAGDVYVANQYVGNINVENNQSSIVDTFTAVGANGAAALIKYADTNGPINTAPLVWAVGLTNNDPASYSYGLGVALAPGNGAYLAAEIFHTNWLGTNRYADSGGGSILLSRFDVNGSNVWSQFITGPNLTYTTYNMLVSDGSGDVTLAGEIFGTTGFGGTNLSAPSGSGFIAQYNPDGSIRWAQPVPVYVFGLAYGSGRIYVSLQAAISGGVTNVSIGGLSNLTDRAWAVACLNATNGQALWLRGVGNQFGANPTGLLNDMPLISTSGTNVFFAGNAFGTAVAFGGLSVSVPGGSGQYFARYDTNGNAQFANVFGSPTTMIWAMAANTSGVYVDGDFDGYSGFGNYFVTAPEYVPSPIGSQYFTQPFVAKFDLNGNPLWARNGVSPVMANFRGIATTSGGVWASGFLQITNELNNGIVPAQFGTNFVASDATLVGSPVGSLVYSIGGLMTKITDSTAAASPVKLIDLLNSGGNFQFSFTSESGFTHYVRYRTNLVSGVWQNYTNLPGDGTLKSISVPMSIFNGSKQGYVSVTTQ